MLGLGGDEGIFVRIMLVIYELLAVDMLRAVHVLLFVRSLLAARDLLAVSQSVGNAFEQPVQEAAGRHAAGSCRSFEISMVTSSSCSRQVTHRG